MRAAAELSTAAYESLRERGLAGRTEREVACDLVRFMEDPGAEGPRSRRSSRRAAHGALPHASPRDAEIPADTLVVVDMGASWTATAPTARARSRPGRWATRRARSTSRAARAGRVARGGARRRGVQGGRRAWRATLIDGAGHGEHFGHGLGHGVGLEVHEAPRLGKTAEGALEAGNAVTVEPGVYLPGRFGVRIEDLVIVSDGEPEILTGFAKELVTSAEVLAAVAALRREPRFSRRPDSASRSSSRRRCSRCWSPHEAVTAMLALATVLNVLVLFGGPKRVDWRRLAPLLAAAVPGLAAGALLLAVLSKEVLQVGGGRRGDRRRPVAAPPAAARRAGRAARRSPRASRAGPDHLAERERPAARALARGTRGAARRVPATLAAAFLLLNMAGGAIVVAAEGTAAARARCLPLLVLRARRLCARRRRVPAHRHERFFVLALAARDRDRSRERARRGSRARVANLAALSTREGDLR